jgi:hypothetical protein
MQLITNPQLNGKAPNNYNSVIQTGAHHDTDAVSQTGSAYVGKSRL